MSMARSCTRCSDKSPDLSKPPVQLRELDVLISAEGKFADCLLSTLKTWQLGLERCRFVEDSQPLPQSAKPHTRRRSHPLKIRLPSILVARLGK